MVLCRFYLVCPFSVVVTKAYDVYRPMLLFFVGYFWALPFVLPPSQNKFMHTFEFTFLEETKTILRI